MTAKALRIIELCSKDPLKNGHHHGEIFRRDIADLAEIRLERMCAVSHFHRPKDALALAEEHLAVLQKFDDEIYLELEGISQASGVSLPLLTILNNYTDMRDIKPAGFGDIGGCSIISSPTDSGIILGQTWDIHGSAEPYVVLLKVSEAVVFSVVGCLGMTGLNSHGVGICINNLSSKEGVVGLMWPALVRKMLTKKTAVLAQAELMAASIGSGRHYAIADKSHFFASEVSPKNKVLICDELKKPYFHTNHCLDNKLAEEHFIADHSNTLERYEHLSKLKQSDLASLEQVFLAFKDVSMPLDYKQPHKIATCGTMVMNVSQNKVLACAGIASEEILSCSQIKFQI